MVNYFQQIPDAGQEQASAIAKGFGGGLSQGLKTGLSQQLSGFLQQKKDYEKIRTNINQLSKRYAKYTHDADTLHKLEKRAKEFKQLGNLSADESSLLAFEEYDKELSPWLNEDKNPGLTALNEIKKDSNSEKGVETADQEIASQIKPGKWTAPPNTQIPLNFLNEPEPEGFWDRVFKQTGGNVALQSHALEQQREAIPQSVYGGIEGSTLGAIKPPQPETEAGEIYRELFKYGGYGKTAGRVQGRIEKVIKPTSVTRKLTAGAITGATVSSAQQMINNGEIDPVQLGIDTAIWTGLEGLFIAAPQVMKLFKKPIEDVAKKTGQTAEEILQTAINDTKTNFEEVLNGDQKEINKLKNRITAEAPGSEKVKATEKTVFNPETAIQKHELHGEKLKASPFGEYFRIENKKSEAEANKTPEERLKDSERKAEIEPKIVNLEKSIEADRKDIQKFEEIRKNSTGNLADRMDLNISTTNRAIEKKLEQLKDLRYELKYGKPRPTAAQLEIDAEKSAKELVESIRNPTPENQKKLARQIELDKQYLKRAEKIRNRGEFDAEYSPDEHIRIMEKYAKAYDSMILNLKEEIKDLKGAKDAESLKKIMDNREAIKQLEARQKRHQANITNQKDKIIALKSIEGPVGAFHKNQIRKTQNEIKEFEKDLFQFKKGAETKSEIGTSKTAQDKIKESGKEFERMEKVGEKVAKDPSNENINSAAEATGQKPQEVKQETDQMGNLFKERSEKVEQGKATEKDVQATGTQVSKQMAKWQKRMKQLPKNVAYGFGLGVISGVIDEYTGVKLPSTLLGALVPGGVYGRLGGGFAAGYGYKVASGFFVAKEAQKLRELRKSPLKYNEYVKSLRGRYKTARVNQILEKSRE